MKKKLAIFFLLILILAAGFFVEYIKVNINYHIEIGSSIPGYFEQTPETRKIWLDSKEVYAPFDYYYSHGRLDMLHLFSLKQLTLLKWGGTVLFTALFLFLNLAVFRLLTGERKLERWIIIGYVILFLFSFFFFFVGKLTPFPGSFYSVSRKIVGALQSPVPLMLIYPAWVLYKTMIKEKSHEVN